ncbi:hypothetical protein L1887_03891 [Cichorium endivia]|nr:hypothetical protein L1887_03891 [Cichorium endivia]
MLISLSSEMDRRRKFISRAPEIGRDKKTSLIVSMGSSESVLGLTEKEKAIDEISVPVMEWNSLSLVGQSGIIIL